MPTAVLGTSNSQLGSMILAYANLHLPTTVGITALVFDSKHVIAQYTVPMDDSALNPINYTLIAISGSPTYIPTITNIEFFDSVHTAVLVSFSDSLTYGQTYSLAVAHVNDLAQDAECDGSSNFLATVPDPPRIIGAYVSGLGQLDVIFDRSVAPYTTGITATLNGVTITQVAYSSGLYPLPNIRFQMAGAPVEATYVVTINASQAIQDISSNTANGGSAPNPGPNTITVPLTLAFRSPAPYTYANFTQAQVIDAFVDHISNDHLNLAYINVYFNAPMLDSDITNAANWTVTQFGTGIPVSIVSIRNYASPGQCDDVSDSETYLCILAVQATDPTLEYVVTVAAFDSTSTSQTNPGNYTGNVMVRSLSDPPRVLATQLYPDGKLFIRFDREPRARDLSDYRLKAAYRNPPITTETFRSVHQTATTKTLNELVVDIFNAYTIHLGTSGHILVDTVDAIHTGDFPFGNEASLIAALNLFKDKFNSHASNGDYHQFSTLFPVTIPNAHDTNSAYALALVLLQAYLDHNANLALHTSMGPVIVSAKKSDGILLDMIGSLDGWQYSATIPFADQIINLAGQAPFSRAKFEIQFIGLQTAPVLASVYPRAGLRINFNMDELVYSSDDILMYFSKPMNPGPTNSQDVMSNLFITGGSATINVLGASWQTKRILDIQVKNMVNSTSYSIQVNNLTDLFGNPIQ